MNRLQKDTQNQRTYTKWRNRKWRFPDY